MIKTLIFDVDGTLGNTLPMCVAAFKKTIATLLEREMSNQEIIALFGPTEEGMMRTVAPDRYDEGMATFHTVYADLHNTMCPRPFDGIVELLDYLRTKDVLLTVVTGKGGRSCEITLDKFGIRPYFAQVIAGSPHGAQKDVDIGTIVADQRLRPEETFYVGDSPYDVTAARQAGVGMFSALWAETARRAEVEKLRPDAAFDSVGQFHDYLRGALEG